jgi:hypothetical protein
MILFTTETSLNSAMTWLKQNISCGFFCEILLFGSQCKVFFASHALDFLMGKVLLVRSITL